jgi:outer membrane protein assembly factor BamB
MDRRRSWKQTILILLAFLFFAPAVHAVIKVLVPLRASIAVNQFIVVAKVDKLFPEKPGVTLAIAEDLKGKAPFRNLAVNLKGDRDSQKTKDTERLLKRLAPDLSLILFINKNEQTFTVFGYSNGTWFQILGKSAEDKVAWSFTHLEPYLRRTFKGTTAELKKIIQDSLAGKIKPPPPNPKEPPGIGPEVKTGNTNSERNCRLQIANCRLNKPVNLQSAIYNLQSGLFAVIPTLGLGGPLAVLALLFPSLFGGVFVLFRRWLAFFSVISVISLLYLVRWIWGNQLRGTWFETPGGLWFFLMVITILGTFWAWQRNWVLLGTGQDLAVPGRAESMILGAVGLTCLGLVVFLYFDPPARGEWQLLLSLSAGVWVAAGYKVIRTFKARACAGTCQLAPAMPTEGIMLGVSLFLMAGFSAFRAGPVPTAGRIEIAEGAKAKLVGKVWDFQVKDMGCNVSAPREAAGRIYFASSQPVIQKGALYCLNRGSGEQIWKFTDGGAMKQVFSSPCLAGGKLFIGEGFHDDHDCKLYCLDALKGKKIWDFQTTGQVESSPCVAGGKVFFGAGNDGIYCLDAKTGAKVWQFPGPNYKGKLLRIGASPLVENGKLYAGSGVDRNLKEELCEKAVFCLDAASGNVIWKKETSLPSWGAPVMSGKEVFFGLGNGDVFNDAANPAGAMLCLDAASGEQIWRLDLPNGILGEAAVDDDHVYFGCRDGYCYCVRRDTGKEVWKTSLGSAVVASPVIASSLTTGMTASVFVIGTKGRVCCLDPASGAIQWTYKLEESAPYLCATPQVVVSHTVGGERRHLYFAATLGVARITELAEGQPVLYRLNDFMAKDLMRQEEK